MRKNQILSTESNIPRGTICLLFVIVCLVSLYQFRSAFPGYFFQDDWFSFLISRVEQPVDIIGFFAPRTDVVYYRPLGMQLPFFLARTLFGFSTWPFRIGTIMLHALNSCLLLIILHLILKDRRLAVLGSLLYATSATHYTIFHWAATFAFVLAPTFYFASVLTYLAGKRGFGLVLFVTGLFANELVLTIPLTLGWYEVLIARHKQFRRLLPYMLILVVYLIFRLTVAHFPTGGAYAFVDQPQQLGLNLRNYTLAALNWPEEISKQFLLFWKINPLFLRDFGKVVLPAALVLLAVLLIGLKALISGRTKPPASDRQAQIAFGICWFVTALLPVLFYREHFYTYYIPIALAGLWVVVLSSLQFLGYQRAILIGSGIFFLWLWASWQTLNFNSHVHWAPQRAKLAHEVVTEVTTTFPQVPPGTTIVVRKEPVAEVKLALGDQSAFQVIYGPTIQTFYSLSDDSKDL